MCSPLLVPRRCVISGSLAGPDANAACAAGFLERVQSETMCLLPGSDGLLPVIVLAPGEPAGDVHRECSCRTADNVTKRNGCASYDVQGSPALAA